MNLDTGEKVNFTGSTIVMVLGVILTILGLMVSFVQWSSVSAYDTQSAFQISVLITPYVNITLVGIILIAMALLHRK